MGRRIWHHGPRTSIFKSSCPAVGCVSQAVDSQVPDWVRVCVPPQCSHAASPTCHHARQLCSPGLLCFSFCFSSSILTLLYSYILTKGCSPLVITSPLLICGSERRMRGTSLSLYSLVSSGSAAAYVVFAIPCESCACSEGYVYQMVAISNWVLLQLGL